MKEKETDVSQLLSKLSLKNNLDQEDEEDEVVESLVVVEQNEENADQFNYTSKAPVRYLYLFIFIYMWFIFEDIFKDFYIMGPNAG